MSETSASAELPPRESPLAFLRRWWGGHPIAQAIGLVALALILGIAVSNILDSMRRLGVSPTLGYLSQPANFDISESLLAYRAGDPYWRAILVGVLNTLKLAVAGCFFATAIGLVLGLARSAGNPVIGRLVAAYVELVRNVPLMLQLFFWIAMTHALPPVRQALEPLPGTFLTIRGVYTPRLLFEGGPLWPMLLAPAAVLLAVGLRRRRLRRPLTRTGRLIALALGLGFPGLWAWSSGVGVGLDLPVRTGFNIEGGLALTPEFAAMAAGLSIYYAANVCEIVRSGMQSVAIGQWEAGLAFGFPRGRLVRRIVLPQAMKVITPLMTSTYLDLTKDTTLGVLIGFTEVTAVIKTSANNTGNAVETILVLLVVFLSIALPVSAAINLYNRSLTRKGVATA